MNVSTRNSQLVTRNSFASAYYINCECGQPLEFDDRLFGYPCACPRCEKPFVIEEPGPESAFAREGRPCSLAWSQWPRLGVIRALLETIKQILVSPGQAFARAPHPRRARYWEFFLAAVMLTVLVSCLLKIPFVLAVPPDAGGNQVWGVVQLRMVMVVAMGSLFNACDVALRDILFAAMTLVFMKVFLPACRARFKELLMIFIFCSGAAMVLMALPGVGPLIFVVTSIYCKVAALRAKYNTGRAIAAIAVLSPLLVLMMLAFMAVASNPEMLQRTLNK